MKGVKWVRKKGIQMTGGRVEEKKKSRGGLGREGGEKMGDKDEGSK